MKKITGFFLSIVMLMLCLPSNAQTMISEGDVTRQVENTPPTDNWVLYTRVGTPPSSAVFVVGPGTPPLGCGSLQLTTVTGAEKVTLFNFDHIGVQLDAIESISYSTYRSAAENTAQVAALNLQIDYNGDAPGGFTTLIFEPVYNTDQGALVNDMWQYWDAINGGAGRWWSSNPIPGLPNRDTFLEWEDIHDQNPDAVILGGVGVNQGSGNPGLTSAVDAFNFNGTIYNFEPDADGDGIADCYDCAPSDKKNDKVMICHNGKTLCISRNAVDAHLAHGDALGHCPASSVALANKQVNRSSNTKKPPVNYMQPSLFGDASYVTPGNNSCNAVKVSSVGTTYGGIDFMVPVGLTVADLEYLSSDYKITQGGAGGGSPRFVAQTPNGNVFFYFGTPPNYTDPADNVWHNSGNLASPLSLVDATQIGGAFYQPYASVQAAYGSLPVEAIYIVADGAWAFPNGQTIVFDNTNVNGTMYNYDDCDNDGVPNDYDCSINDKKNDKVIVCHNGKALCVAQSAVKAHLDHGDQLGACPTAAITREISPEFLLLEEVKVAAYPSPSNGQFNVQLPVLQSAKAEIVVMNLDGKVISRRSVNADGQVEKFDLRKQASGVYFIKVVSEEGVQNLKVVVQR